jgi:hypothetical protein
MAKKVAKEAKPKKVKVYKRAQIGKRPPRNFWFDGFAGECEEPVEVDGKEIIPLRTTKRFGGGERYKLAGADMVIYQRSAADKLGAVEVGRVEARAKADGTLTLQIWGLKRNGEMKRLHDITSHRFGVPVDSPLLSEEKAHGKAEADEAGEGDGLEAGG